jgi:methyl-accepting chemotaxis protein
MNQLSRIAAENSAIDAISQNCGEVAVGCSDIAGIVSNVIASSARLRAEHDALQGTVEALEADHRLVAEASDEARLLSQQAIGRLAEGTKLMHGSLGQISGLIKLVENLGQHVSSFAAAMEQVRRSSKDIEEIAETTDILSLNAAIEAQRAGAAGRTFAVVAAEVKTLAGRARMATEEIAATVNALGGEAEQVIKRIEDSEKESTEARSSIARIEQTIGDVSDLVTDVDRQNDQITRATGKMTEHVGSVREMLGNYDLASRDNEGKLKTANGRIVSLELTASEMFDNIVKAGFSPEDIVLVERAQEYAQQVAVLTERALADGSLSTAALFDHDYQEIPGSNPKRYRNRLMDWAHQHWRPMLDGFSGSDPRVMAAACTDVNGYLPTHLTEHSRNPTGDVQHDTKYCRNGRILFDELDRKAKVSQAPYMMAVYRQEGDGQEYRVVRNVYIPLIIDGRRWGDFELAYSL